MYNSLLCAVFPRKNDTMACAERGAAGIIPYFVPSSRGRTMACAERGAAGIIPYFVPSSQGRTMACAEKGAAGKIPYFVPVELETCWQIQMSFCSVLLFRCAFALATNMAKNALLKRIRPSVGTVRGGNKAFKITAYFC